MGKIHTMLLVLSNTSAFIDIHLVIRPNKITKRDYVLMSWFLFKIELLHILRIFPSRRQALSCTNPPATGLILLLQATQDFVMDCVWLKTNGADSSQVPEALQRLCRIPRQALEPFSFSTKELVEYWQYRGIWEEVGLIELADLDASVGAHVQVDMLASVQEVLLSAFGQTCYHQLIAMSRFRFLSSREHYQSTIWTSKRRNLVFILIFAGSA